MANLSPPKRLQHSFISRTPGTTSGLCKAIIRGGFQDGHSYPDGVCDNRYDDHDPIFQITFHPAIIIDEDGGQCMPEMVDHPAHYGGEDICGDRDCSVCGVNADEQVNHPSHYGGADNPYEHVKVMEAWGLVENAFLYQATKYICRAGKKSATTTIEDLKKAVWYVNRAIQYEEQKERQLSKVRHSSEGASSRPHSSEVEGRQQPRD